MVQHCRQLPGASCDKTRYQQQQQQGMIPQLIHTAAESICQQVIVGHWILVDNLQMYKHALAKHLTVVSNS
jgi:hypothetical protein